MNGYLMCLLLEAYRSRSRVLGIAALLPAFINVALLVWHARLTSMMNFADQSASGSFYGELRPAESFTILTFGVRVKLTFANYWSSSTNRALT